VSSRSSGDGTIGPAVAFLAAVVSAAMLAGGALVLAPSPLLESRGSNEEELEVRGTWSVLTTLWLDAAGTADSSAPCRVNRVVPMSDGATSAQARLSLGPAGAPATRLARAEPVVRRLLVVPDPERRADRQAEAAAHRLFNFSMALSGLRCLLGYVVLPIVTPALGAAARVGPIVGIPIAVVALCFDVMAVRRFWTANHRWRWGISLIYLVVMCLVSVLLVRDVVHLAH